METGRATGREKRLEGETNDVALHALCEEAQISARRNNHQTISSAARNTGNRILGPAEREGRGGGRENEKGDGENDEEGEATREGGYDVVLHRLVRTGAGFLPRVG